MLNSLELRIARQRRGLMQKDLASVLGLTPVTYSQKERGRRHMSVDEAQKVAKTLRLKDDEILGIFFGGGVNAKYKDENTGVHGNTEQIHLDGCVVVYAMYSCCFWVEIRLFRCRAVDQKPTHRIGNGSLAETVCPVNVRIFAVEVDGKFLNSPEIRERETQNLHVVPPSEVEISMGFMYNTRRLFSRCSSGRKSSW